MAVKDQVVGHMRSHPIPYATPTIVGGGESFFFKKNNSEGCVRVTAHDDIVMWMAGRIGK